MELVSSKDLKLNILISIMILIKIVKLIWLFSTKNYFSFCFKDMVVRRLKDIGVGKVLDILKLKLDFKTLELNF